MFILFGRWHFGRKAVAYRADWCTVCERRIVAQAIRSFDWFHIYLVPLMPLGHWWHWVCPRCEKHPHLKGTGLLQAIIVALLFMPFFLTAILYWTMSTAGLDGDNIWMVRIFLTVFAAKQNEIISHKGAQRTQRKAFIFCSSLRTLCPFAANFQFRRIRASRMSK